jgi:hypothetical protein
MSEPQTNLFLNEGNFNSRHNPYHKPAITHILPTFFKDNNSSKDKDPTVPETNDLTTYTTSQLLTDEIPSHEVTNLMKIYQDKEKKFGGELYNTLGAKLQVFWDCCSKVGLMRHQYHHAFSVMLKERAATFYYDYIAGKRHNFDTMLQLIRTYFETDENQQLYMSEWRDTTFHRVISSNLTKSCVECLQLLFDILQKVQRGLAKSY